MVHKIEISRVSEDGEPAEVKVGLFSLWAIGVGSFIGGNFIGWPSVLVGGFGAGLASLSFFGIYFMLLGNVTGLRLNDVDPETSMLNVHTFCRGAGRPIQRVWRNIYVQQKNIWR